MRVSKGTLRRRFRFLKNNLPDQVVSQEFNKLSFKEWVRKHSDNIVKHYEKQASDRDLTFTDPVMELLT